MQSFLLLIQIDKRSRLSEKKQIIQQFKEAFHMYNSFSDSIDLNESILSSVLNISVEISKEILEELVELGYLIKEDKTYQISDNQALKYILPKPFGRRTFIKNPSIYLKEEVVLDEWINTPKHLTHLFSSLKIRKIEKKYFSDSKLKAHSLIYINSDGSHEEMEVKSSDQYLRMIDLVSNDRTLDQLFHLQKGLYLKGEYSILRDGKCIEFGNVTALSEYSFKTKIKHSIILRDF